MIDWLNQAHPILAALAAVGCLAGAPYNLSRRDRFRGIVMLTLGLLNLLIVLVEIVA